MERQPYTIDSFAGITNNPIWRGSCIRFLLFHWFPRTVIVAGLWSLLSSGLILVTVYYRRVVTRNNSYTVFDFRHELHLCSYANPCHIWIEYGKMWNNTECTAVSQCHILPYVNNLSTVVAIQYIKCSGPQIIQAQPTGKLSHIRVYTISHKYLYLF